MKIKSVTFAPLASHAGWYVSPDVGSDFEPLEALALKLQPDAQAQGLYCVCGAMAHEGYRLYLVPALGVRCVIEGFAVGAHGESDPHAVFEEIAAADASNPLVPYFADRAGLKAKFSRPVTPEIIELLAATLTSCEPMLDEDASIASYVKTNKGVHLWWD